MDFSDLLLCIRGKSHFTETTFYAHPIIAWWITEKVDSIKLDYITQSSKLSLICKFQQYPHKISINLLPPPYMFFRGFSLNNEKPSVHTKLHTVSLQKVQGCDKNNNSRKILQGKKLMVLENTFQLWEALKISLWYAKLPKKSYLL